MNILAITADTLYLALISIGVVFVILIVLVLILNIFTLLATKTMKGARVVKDSHTQYKQAKSFANASDEDKAAVAMALYLYAEEKKNLESRVLTIKHSSQAWSSELNPRL
jgi:Na+-transporting methylmalonyl-CoA/oxaloacetate decarboxylase gamma subunit